MIADPPTYMPASTTRHIQYADDYYDTRDDAWLWQIRSKAIVKLIIGN
jgi:hypothetical protein